MVNGKNKVEDGSGGVGLGLGATAKLSRLSPGLSPTTVEK